MTTRGKWILSLINKHNWIIGAELGVQKGNTYLFLLENCPNLTLIGVDIWAKKEARELENTDNLEDFESINYGFYRHIKIETKKYNKRAITYRMFTTEAVKLIQDKSLDFIFVDADHTEQGVKRDILDWMPKIKDTGWILGHDIHMGDVKKAVEELVPGYILGLDNCWARQKCQK